MHIFLGDLLGGSRRCRSRTDNRRSSPFHSGRDEGPKERPHQWMESLKNRSWDWGPRERCDPRHALPAPFAGVSHPEIAPRRVAAAVSVHVAGQGPRNLELDHVPVRRRSLSSLRIANKQPSATRDQQPLYFFKIGNIRSVCYALPRRHSRALSQNRRRLFHPIESREKQICPAHPCRNWTPLPRPMKSAIDHPVAHNEPRQFSGETAFWRGKYRDGGRHPAD